MIVLDTHAFVWLVGSPERLSLAAEKAIAQDLDLAISMVSIQEIAYLAARDRLAMDRPLANWLTDSIGLHDVRALSATVATSMRAGSLDPESFHGDPVDRLIYATAVEHDAKLVTADRRLREADPARTIW